MASVIWSGLDDLERALRDLPDRLVGEAVSIVNKAASDAMADMAAQYPTRTGNLARGLRLQQASLGRYGVGYQVKNSAKHAWIFENGSMVRHTRIGANRGAMPPGHVFVPTAIRHRAAMYRNLAAMLEREGLLVTGVAA